MPRRSAHCCLSWGCKKSRIGVGRFSAAAVMLRLPISSSKTLCQHLWQCKSMGASVSDYARYMKLLGERALPCALVDLDALDRNIAVVREAAAGKAVRVASKSVRHLGLLR